MRKRTLSLAGVVLVCAWTSVAFAQVVGNWEGSMDSWALWATAPAGTTTAFSPTGATLGTQALQLSVPESGYHEALYVPLDDLGLVADFFTGGTFSVDVSRVASEWTGTPENGYCGLHLIVNADSSLGPVYAILPFAGNWTYRDGNTTVTATFDYTAVKALIDRPTVTFLELVLATNYDPLYTTAGSYYLDNARLEPPPPELPVIGDWENRLDTWYRYGAVYPTWAYSTTTGVTLHNYSLKITFNAPGERNGPVWNLGGVDARIDAFLANDMFSVDVTRLASEWTRGTGNHYSLLGFVVNAGFSDGTPAIWAYGTGTGGPWDSTTGDSTQTVSWDYSTILINQVPLKDFIAARRTAISWFQILLTSNVAGYTPNYIYYLDNGRLGPAPPQPQNFFTINTFDSAAEVAQWTPPAETAGQAPTVLEFDPLVDADDSAASGSMKVSVQFDPDNTNITSYQSIITRDMFPTLPVGVDLTDYVVFKAKVRVDPSSPLDPWGSHGFTNWVFRDFGFSWDQWSAGGNLGEGWVTYQAAMSPPPSMVPPRDFFRALSYQIGGNMIDPAGQPYYMNGTTIVWIDNIQIGRMRECHDPMHCELCDDEADNNDDGLVDCADSDCPGTTWCPGETVCNDGYDGPDADGLIDCSDPDCDAEAHCMHNDPFADVDGDGDVDMMDFATYQRCYSLVVPVPQGCGFLDRDNDGDIDGQDFTAFQQCAGGPEAPVDPSCDDAP